MYAAPKFQADKIAKQGINCGRDEIVIHWEIPKPTPIPITFVNVNYDTAFPEMSPILLALANLTLIEEREAEAKRKVIFLHPLAREASSKNELGKASVIHSI